MNNCDACGEWMTAGFEHRCPPGYLEASAAGRLHLESWSDREESTAYCTGAWEYPSTKHTPAVTCKACLVAAVAEADRMAAECRARLLVIVPCTAQRCEA